LKSAWSKQTGRACILLVVGIPLLWGLWRITRPRMYLSSYHIMCRVTLSQLQKYVGGWLADCGFGRSDGGYSIAIYSGPSLRGLAPRSPNLPVLTAGDVTVFSPTQMSTIPKWCY
jgi:hypothetical protein